MLLDMGSISGKGECAQKCFKAKYDVSIWGESVKNIIGASYEYQNGEAMCGCVTGKKLVDMKNYVLPEDAKFEVCYYEGR